MRARYAIAITAILGWGCVSYCAVLSVDLTPAADPGPERYMTAPPEGAPAGSVPIASTSPTGSTIGYDRLSLLKDGKPWIPVMGEFHYSRYPAAEWREELLKMKAGGITLVSTYVFWIYHEEVQGKFTWDGDKNLHEFVKLCGEVGLPCIVRIGPWCHGEVRNGGFPDWVEALPRKRTNDPVYLAVVKPYIDQIGLQLKGQLFKDGGPVIGIQLENEFKGPAAHLVTLKQYARDAGIDVPIYTRTAWDNATDIPKFGEVLPLWGGYAEGFWDRSLESMPGNYWQVFRFGVDRAPNAAMGDPTYAAATERGEAIGYPYLTCELGGGMMSSYHRRILINPMDGYSLALTKVGSGSNMPGYYMYHGGINPDGLTTDMMQETQSRGMWNDMPYKNYDFQAPLGEFGQVRESYYLLRELHLFLQDFGPSLARMTPIFSTANITKNDTGDTRWSVRSDGEHAFIFVNNYQRSLNMPAKPETQFSVKLARGATIKIPENGGLNIPANSACILPVNFDLGGINLIYATAQPLCKVETDGETFTLFTSIPGADAEFVVDQNAVAKPLTQRMTLDGNGKVHIKALKNPAVEALDSLTGPDGKKQTIIVVSDQAAMAIAKLAIGRRQYAVLAPGFCTSADKLTVQLDPRAAGGEMLFIPQMPAGNAASSPSSVTRTDKPFGTLLKWNKPEENLPNATIEEIKPAGPLRTIKKATTAQGVAEQPAAADWDNAAVYRITLPANLPTDKETRTLLRLNYTGDVARIYLDGKLILDDFYNTEPLELGLWRYPGIATKELLVKILPLQKGAPIALPKWPDFGNAASVVDLKSAELIPERSVTVEVK